MVDHRTPRTLISRSSGSAVRLGRSTPTLLVALGLAAASLGACASAPGPQQLAPVLPSAGPTLEMASPAARDALLEGLRHIAADAPLTRVTAIQPPADEGAP